MAYNLDRKRNVRRPNKVIRIYTEGEQTEPNYLNAIKSELRLFEVDIKVTGLADHTDSLVNRVIDDMDRIAKSDEDTEWWVVFDKDDHPNFNKAIQLATSKGIKVAYSIECFEHWIVLHYEFLNTSTPRNKLSEKISELIGKKYEKCDKSIYDLIRPRESQAIRWAKKLEEHHDTANISSHSRRQPSTTMYKLVESLRSLKIQK